jgi:hypothetical protein
MMKKLGIFGTRHYTHKRLPDDIRAAMEMVVDEHAPTIGLEEWSTKQIEVSGFKVVCDAKGVPWASIGTPPTADLATYVYTDALDFPSGANIQRYGPFEIQEKREHLMRTSIIDAMSSHDSAVLVLGVAHLHSMCMKLKRDFDIRAWSFGPEIL